MRCIDWYADRSLVVIDLGFACCAVESEAAAVNLPLTDVRDDDAVAIVVSGTVTDAAVPLLQEVRARFPQAKVVSFGACATSGGPYWDSYVVTKGIGQLMTVDLFVPGCPPPPDALHDALGRLRKVPA